MNSLTCLCGGWQVTGGNCLRIFIGWLCVCVFLSMQTLANKVIDSLTTPVFSNGVELFGACGGVYYNLCGFETSFPLVFLLAARVL